MGACQLPVLLTVPLSVCLWFGLCFGVCVLAYEAVRIIRRLWV